MSKKEKKEKEEETKAYPKWPFVMGLCLCGLAFFFLIAFISYCFTWQQDQIQTTNTIYNSMGRVGYVVAKWAIGMLGLGALLFPGLLFLIGYKLLRPLYEHFTRYVLILIAGAFILSLTSTFLLWPLKSSATWFAKGVGGSHGRDMIHLLINSLGVIGTFMFLCFVVFLYSLFLTPRTIDWTKSLFRTLQKMLLVIYVKIKDLMNRQADDKADEKAEKKKAKLKDGNKTPLIEEEDEDDERDEKSIDLITAQLDTSKKQSSSLPKEDDFVIIRNEDEEYVFPEEGELPTPELSATELLNKRMLAASENIEIEEIYLPEHMLVGELYDPTKDLSGYKRPPIDLLEDYQPREDKIDTAELNRNKDKIVQILGHYKIGIEKIFATVGPTVTLYEVIPKDGVRISQIKRLEDDIALRIAALGVRIIAPIPGKGTVGIEVPNEKPDIVAMRTIIKSAKFQESKFDLPVALGKTILGEVFAFDLAKMPHLLVAGATGQGKSVGLNAILTSLLYKKHPAELKIVMVDPKKVELAPYSKIDKHFLAKLPDAEEPIITDTQKVVFTLKSLCIEMDNRYDLLKIAGVRNVKEYNEKFINRRLNPQKGHHYMPYIVLVIDEFADLIMTAGREVEEPIARLAQLARAIGIHLVIATQRPTTNIITGLIKANFPARIAFRVTSMIDSRTILDTPGANQLIGRGDMLISTGADIIRVQCAFVDTPEVDRITDYISTQPGYGAAYDLPEFSGEEGKDGPKQVDMRNLDDQFEEAAKIMVQHQQGSTSLIQRKLSLGYNRAGRIMDQLEAAGIVGPPDGSKARQVLVPDFNTLDGILIAFRK